MFNKFYKLDFGLQMIITCLVLFISNQLMSYTLSMANTASTVSFNVGVVLTLSLFLLQTLSIYFGVMSIINYIKQTKNNNEQSN
jgi:hypothetical protein